MKSLIHEFKIQKIKIMGKNQIKQLSVLCIFVLSTLQSYAGLEWTYGALSSPDNKIRNAKAIAYAANGNIFVTGLEELSSASKLIVTKKFSATGSLLASVTNSYAVAVGTTVNDNATDIKLDANNNVYVLGKQYATSSRGYDVVLIKYNSSLTQQWKKLIYNTNQPNNFNDKPCKILLDANNDVYATGNWNNVTITGFTEEIFVQKYSSAGTLLYSTNIPQAMGKTIEDATDFSIDNNLNVTVCARAKDGNNVYSVMYTRISNTGSVSWKKFYTPSSTFKYLFKPEIECLSSGTFYISTAVDREVGPDMFVRIATAKFNSSGTLSWENLSAELHEYADNVYLRLDASGNIYAGCDFLNSPTPTYKNHRIYKMNSSGTLQWIYTSAETSNFFSFETFNSSALFLIFSHTSGVNPILRKLDATNGAVLWSETIAYTPPATYHHCQVIHTDIAVNPSTSEVAFCGYISADMITPTYNQEYRWLIKKYGATSPRFVSSENPVAAQKLDFKIFPNPANQNVTIQSDAAPETEIIITDLKGRKVHQQKFENGLVNFNVSDFRNGMYNVTVNRNGITKTSLLQINH